MTVQEPAAGLTALVQNRQAQWCQWQEQIDASSDSIAEAIRDRVMEVISNYFEEQVISPIFSLPTNDHRQAVQVDCSFSSPMSSIFWQCVPEESDSEPHVLMTIRDTIPGVSEKEVKGKVVMEEMQPHVIKPKVDFDRIDQLLVGIATKATEQIKEALRGYAEKEGNSVLKFDVRLSTGCHSSSAFGSKSMISKSEPQVVTSFWVDEPKAILSSSDESQPKSYSLPGSALFGFLSSSKKQ